jgi:hypothetical protein
MRNFWGGRVALLTHFFKNTGVLPVFFSILVSASLSSILVDLGTGELPVFCGCFQGGRR